MMDNRIYRNFLIMLKAFMIMIDIRTGFQKNSLKKLKSSAISC